MHIHIHALIHYARLLGNIRFLGTMLLMLVISMLQLDTTKTASLTGMTKAAHHDRTVRIPGDSSVRGYGRGAGVPSVWKSAETDPVPPAAINKNAHTSVFHRLEAGLVMVPRMNRTPKPKSVYRNFARAPGLMAPRNSVTVTRQCFYG
jgi:hypothetical protein